jgi:hypothetical protein
MIPLDNLKVISVVVGLEALLDPATFGIDPPLDVFPKETVPCDLSSVLDDPKRVLRYLKKHVIPLAVLDPLRIATPTNLESMLGRNLSQNLVETIVGYHLLGLLK